MAGGIAVSAFAVLGDSLRPKSFARLFGAAPSIALATLLTACRKGRSLCGAFGRAQFAPRPSPS
jgi:hypothetical protein